jgi:hypothetical protein
MMLMLLLQAPLTLAEVVVVAVTIILLAQRAVQVL